MAMHVLTIKCKYIKSANMTTQRRTRMYYVVKLGDKKGTGLHPEILVNFYLDFLGQQYSKITEMKLKVGLVIRIIPHATPPQAQIRIITNIIPQ